MFYILFFLYYLQCKAKKSAGEVEITAHKIPKEVNPKPCRWIYTAAMKNDRLAARTPLVPTCSLFSLPKLFILNCSIFKVTAWFHIHNLFLYECPILFQPADKSPAWTQNANHRSLGSDWSLLYLPAATLFHLWKQTLTAQPLYYSPLYLIFFSFSAFRVSLPIS